MPAHALSGLGLCVAFAASPYEWRLYGQSALYHRPADPQERANPAGRPEHADVQRRIRDAMPHRLVSTSYLIPTETDPRLPHVDLLAPGAGG